MSKETNRRTRAPISKAGKGATPASDGRPERGKVEPITITWSLAELPSTQHRAGLAGLVMLVDYTRRHSLPDGAVLEVAGLDEVSYSLRLNIAGCAALFDKAYAAALQEREYSKPWVNKHGTEKPPKRRETKTTTDKKGKTKEKEVCFYDVVVPHGGPLGDLAPLGDDSRWIELWRSWLRSTLRTRAMQMIPYNQRAGHGALVEDDDEGDGVDDGKDVAVAWECLTSERSVKLASTFYLGAMDVNAEAVPFRDRGRFLFLLHFWPFAVHVFIPRSMDAKGNIERDGFVTCVPEVSRLASFVRRHERALKARSPDGDRIWSATPKQATIDLADAAAFESERWLENKVADSVQQADARATAGFLVIHSRKESNSVRILSSRLIAPTREQVDRAQIVSSCWSHLAKHQVLRNVLANRSWWHGFDRACSTVMQTLTIKDSAFRHDARVLFEHFHPENRMTDTTDEVTKTPRTLESLVLHIVQNWITGRLDGKYQLRWSEVKGQPKRQAEYDERKSKLATEAFLAARSRPGREFARWFTATLCSVNQRLTEAEFVAVARALDGSPDQVRSLTLLALSARG